MRFSLISDMHVDFPQNKTPYDLFEENVVVAGDTSNGLDGLKFLQKLRNKGFAVYAVDGNHEHYFNSRKGRSAEETTARFREDHRRYHDDIPMALANGWYHVHDEPLWQGYMNDSRMTGLSADDVNRRAVADTELVENYLKHWQMTQRSGVVVTHTAPCLDTLNPEYEGHFSNEWYWNPGMRELIRRYPDQIKVWCHGHTHASSDKLVDGVRVVCNPRGYPGENPDWAPLTLEV